MPPKSPIRPENVDAKACPSEKMAASPMRDQNRGDVAQAVQPVPMQKYPAAGNGCGVQGRLPKAFRRHREL
ncbi:MAG TPA: hypothetical protein VGP72_01725 [Planctomycetota bacterium]